MRHRRLVSMELASDSELDQPPPATSHRMSVLHVDGALLFDKHKTNTDALAQMLMHTHAHINAAHTCAHKLIKPIARD